ncbi:WDFY2 [Lepeophtheirus salmonis]|uniref:WDFY2 n=1 Tax=Lepeophtheirus salmonis TaxID=72036 RepID=A0A7R8CKE7_LEPSM|nr:WDFY2 [Lepeophtheirus salmonis]CAF2847438.1 WDFY2 [Lepeophtheirus salmonis]
MVANLTAGSLGGGSLPAEHHGRAGTGPNGEKPQLINRCDGGSDEVNDIHLLDSENGLISISSDRSVRVWLLRDTGQYWPSICHYMNSAVTALNYHEPQRRLFVGLDSGVISEFVISSDYNSMKHVIDYHAHQGRITAVKYSPNHKYILSVARDKYFQFHCTESGKRLGGYLCNSWCTAVEYDEQDKYVFIGDVSGIITVCKLSGGNGVQLIILLKAMEEVFKPYYGMERKGWLYSCGFDCSVFVWDIGGRKGTVFELYGHKNKVTCIYYSSTKEMLFSSGEDMNLVQWDMSVQREITADWNESDSCQLCNRPFFWNLKAMQTQKQQLGYRQHHCRKCGKAICSSCSTRRSQLPRKGHEFVVRVCEECFFSIKDNEKTSLANFYDLKQNVLTMKIDEAKKVLASVGKGGVIKICHCLTL